MTILRRALTSRLNRSTGRVRRVFLPPSAEIGDPYPATYTSTY